MAFKRSFVSNTWSIHWFRYNPSRQECWARRCGLPFRVSQRFRGWEEQRVDRRLPRTGQTYVRYLRQSNTICHGQKQKVMYPQSTPNGWLMSSDNSSWLIIELNKPRYLFQWLCFFSLIADWQIWLPGSDNWTRRLQSFPACFGWYSSLSKSIIRGSIGPILRICAVMSNYTSAQSSDEHEKW